MKTLKLLSDIFWVLMTILQVAALLIKLFTPVLDHISWWWIWAPSLFTTALLVIVLIFQIYVQARYARSLINHSKQVDEKKR